MQRFAQGLIGKSAAVVSDGIVYAVAFDPDCGEGIHKQTVGTLRYLDQTLKTAGSDKYHLLQATVYLTDISKKPQMDEVWNDWIGGAENWPQRACVGAALDPGYLIEIVVTAKTKS